MEILHFVQDDKGMVQDDKGMVQDDKGMVGTMVLIIRVHLIRE